MNQKRPNTLASLQYDNTTLHKLPALSNNKHSHPQAIGTLPIVKSRSLIYREWKWKELSDSQKKRKYRLWWGFQRRILLQVKTLWRSETSNQRMFKFIKHPSPKEYANYLLFLRCYELLFQLNSTDSSSTATSQLFQRMSDLQIVPLADALVNRKFWMMSKIIVAMVTGNYWWNLW